MNNKIIETFISILRKHPAEAETFLQNIAEHLRDVFLHETQSRTDLLYDWTYEQLQESIREDGRTIQELRNMKELHHYMDGLAVKTPARDLAVESLLSLGGVLSPTSNIEFAHASTSIQAQECAHAPYDALFSY
jgi:hypothetical protein